MQRRIRLITAPALAAVTLLLLTVSASAQWHGRHWQPQQIQNLYCSAPAYIVPFEPRNAGINIGPNGYVITIASALSGDPATVRALLAHECGHVIHKHGMHNLSGRMIQHNELQADCTAARLLMHRNDRAGLAALIKSVGRCGPVPSGHPAYPTCDERRERIRACS
ncbi:MAG: hypothetical protein U5L08_16515 [Xanthomonadales bacterium]|nr:hypothetical protein [Xanthomonadales bacterium]